MNKEQLYELFETLHEQHMSKLRETNEALKTLIAKSKEAYNGRK